jgi:hypothetical protein
VQELSQRPLLRNRRARGTAPAVAGTTRSLPVAAIASTPIGSGYRLEAGIVGWLREERRALIEAAQVELVERDGGAWQLRRLPSAVTE